ncbi:uncharacterized protein METZ01_LOCUS493200, partial [marine metagenome]
AVHVVSIRNMIHFACITIVLSPLCGYSFVIGSRANRRVS